MSNVDHPDHYNKGGIECIAAIKEAVVDLSGIEGFYIGNAMKYLWRWKQKNGIEDIEKAVWYLNKLLEVLECETSASAQDAEPLQSEVLLSMDNQANISLNVPSVTPTSTLTSLKNIKSLCTGTLTNISETLELTEQEKL